MQKTKYLHFKPTFESPLVYKDRYYDISNSDLCVWSLNDFSLINCYPKVSEAYYIKLRIISEDHLLIAQNDILKIFNLKEGRVVDKIQEKDFIQNVETEPTNGIVVTVVAGEDQCSKRVTKWILDNSTLRKIQFTDVKYQSDITQDSFTLSVFPSGKIYLYRIGSEKIYQIVVEEKQFKGNTIPATTSIVLQLENQKNFAVASQGKISINDPVKGSVFGNIQCEGEIYSSILQLSGKDSLITSSNKAIKLWVLESKTEPKLFQKSQKLQIDRLHIFNDKLIGMSTKSKILAIWNLQTQQLIKQQKICRQQIQKSFKFGDSYICLVIKVFDETEESLSFHHRLQIIDIATDALVTSKQVKNASFQIQVDTIIPVDKQIIRFICSADKGDKQKSYLFSWRPFTKEEKKQMSKIQMTKAPITKLYTYDRLLLVTPPKEKTQVYQVFKKSQHVTIVTLYTHSLKKITELTLQGYYEDMQLNSSDKLYAIRPEKISIFSFHPKTSTFENQNSIEIQVSKIYFINNFILGINRQNDRILWDQKFQFIMKHSGDGEGIIEIIEQSADSFIVVNSEQTIQKWDIKEQKVSSFRMQLEMVGVCMQGLDRLLITQSDRIQRLNLSQL